MTTQKLRWISTSCAALAIHISAASHAKLDISTVSSMLPSLAASACELFYKRYYKTLQGFYIAPDALSLLTIIREGNSARKNDQGRHYRSPYPGSLIAKHRRYPNNRQQSSYSGRSTRVSKSTSTSLHPAKIPKINGSRVKTLVEYIPYQQHCGLAHTEDPWNDKDLPNQTCNKKHVDHKPAIFLFLIVEKPTHHYIVQLTPLSAIDFR